jgi:hypothetical protein
MLNSQKEFTIVNHMHMFRLVCSLVSFCMWCGKSDSELKFRCIFRLHKKTIFVFLII